MVAMSGLEARSQSPNPPSDAPTAPPPVSTAAKPRFFGQKALAPVPAPAAKPAAPPLDLPPLPDEAVAPDLLISRTTPRTPARQARASSRARRRRAPRRTSTSASGSGNAYFGEKPESEQDPAKPNKRRRPSGRVHVQVAPVPLRRAHRSEHRRQRRLGLPPDGGDLREQARRGLEEERDQDLRLARPLGHLRHLEALERPAGLQHRAESPRTLAGHPDLRAEPGHRPAGPRRLGIPVHQPLRHRLPLYHGQRATSATSSSSTTICTATTRSRSSSTSIFPRSRRA